MASPPLRRLMSDRIHTFVSFLGFAHVYPGVYNCEANLPEYLCEFIVGAGLTSPELVSAALSDNTAEEDFLKAAGRHFYFTSLLIFESTRVRNHFMRPSAPDKKLLERACAIVFYQDCNRHGTINESARQLSQGGLSALFDIAKTEF